MSDAELSAVLDRLAEAARTYHGSPQLRARLADVVHRPLLELTRLKSAPRIGRPRSALTESIRRLAGRPQGVTNGEVSEAAGISAQKAGGALGTMVAQGNLFKARTVGRRTRFFLTEPAAAEFKARLDAATP